MLIAHYGTTRAISLDVFYTHNVNSLGQELNY